MTGHGVHGVYTILAEPVDDARLVGLVRENLRREEARSPEECQAVILLAKQLHQVIIDTGVLGGVPPAQAGMVILRTLSMALGLVAHGVDPVRALNVYAAAALRLVDGTEDRHA
jgi:hypothetical protein